MKTKPWSACRLLFFITIIGIFITNYGAAIADTPLVDTEHKDIVVGTITIGEFKENLIKFLKQHPEFKDQLHALEHDNVPPDIKLEKLAPNPNYNPLNNAHKVYKYTAVNMPSSYKLNLPGPLLDQGNFNTCVTFSMLGAMANSKNSSRFMSESQNTYPPFVPSASCFLQMLRSNGRNAWNGYWLGMIFPSVQKQGVISNDIGKTGFCNDAFPVYEPYGDYLQAAQLMKISTNTYVSQSDKMPLEHLKDNWFSNSSDALHYIKQQISDRSDIGVYQRRGFYTVFAFYFSTIPNYQVTLMDGILYPVWLDTGYVNKNAGHAIFAYGYDDNLIVNGQRGVLFLRNSWGTTMNDSGNYLMTYSYFIRNFRTDDSVVSMYANCKMAGPPRIGCRD